MLAMLTLAMLVMLERENEDIGMLKWKSLMIHDELDL